MGGVQITCYCRVLDGVGFEPCRRRPCKWMSSGFHVGVDGCYDRVSKDTLGRIFARELAYMQFFALILQI